MIGTIIVVYNPDLALTERLITRVYGQTDILVIVDNSAQKNDFTKIVEHYDYIHCPDNIGIAAAHNKGLKHLLASGCEYGLLLDQDSQIPSDMAFSLSSLLVASKSLEHNIIAIGPQIHCQFTDKKVRSLIQKEVFEYEDLVGVTQIIASGMMIDLGLLDTVGLKDDSLFIDGVDHEWCWRARRLNFSIARAKKVEMVHRLGDSRAKFIGLTYKVGSPIRLYYQFRNILLLSRRSYVPLYWKIRCICFIPIRIFLNAILQDQKRTRIRYMCRGLIDGIKGSSGPYQQNWS
ncbi:glycosyltransferase family 2 protein [Shewanella youngdeokensis]|uniref:Glycosyltransferase family 2 protein n=1 Tax=Shewanella youngdeokensis TaxID=2999068 RepID=A0ABZ0K1G1_9GAMM|nr:glycosyltransferase family 2 protein [Shewanella sp. DAU334]